MKKILTPKFLIMLIGLSLFSCQKQDDWLNEKSTKSDVVPETQTDFQAILDNTLEMNDRSFSNAGLVASDNIVVPDENMAEYYEFEKNIYLWDRNVWETGNSNTWNYGHRVIEFANLTLEGLKDAHGDPAKMHNIEGQARFFRAIAMYNLAQLFCKSYQAGTATGDLGLVIRESPDVNVVINHRANMKQTYDFMISDLKAAEGLLPDKQIYIQRPSRIAVKCLLAKIYLAMEDYPNALSAATEGLSAYSPLLDFNNKTIINYTSPNRFPLNGAGNPEIIFYAHAVIWQSGAPTPLSLAIADPLLYASYNTNDLRKELFFTLRNNKQCFAGTYNGNYRNFAGIATNEIFLIKAECEARAGHTTEAMSALNTLLERRFKTGTFIPLTATNADDALSKILIERRKELPMTGNLRWEDLKRLNHDPRFQKTLTRLSKGITYTLPPNDKRYVFPIPANEIQMSGIEQNEL